MTPRMIAPVLIALVILVACSSSGHALQHSATVATDSASALSKPINGLPAHPTTGPVAHRVFLKVARQYFPGVDDATLEQVAHAMCSDFKDGTSWVAELKAMLDKGLPARKDGAFIATAVEVYCPDMAGILPSG